MKSFSKPDHLKYVIPAAGLAGFALRAALYQIAADGAGLLRRNHPLALILWILTAAVLVKLLLACRKIQSPEQYANCFRPSVPAALGCAAAAVGIFLTAPGFPAADRLTLVYTILGWCSAAGLLVLGFCRFAGFSAGFLPAAALCLYFALGMICRYQSWSSDPQLQNYCFQLLACVSLMLTAYHHAAFGAELGSHKGLWFFSLASVYFCALSLAGPEHWLFYLAAGIWALTNLTSLTAPKRRRRTTPDPEAEPAPGDPAGEARQ